MKELRPYQEKIVNDVINSKKDLIVCLPCGAGKTVIASAIMQRLPGKKLFIVPRLELIKQAHDEFGDVDVIWSNKTEITGKDIILASKDSLRTQIEKVPSDRPLTLIFDECHIGIEQTYHLVNSIKPTRVLGLTATPERMDGLALLKGSDEIHRFGVFDEVLKAETTPSLIRKNYLAPLHYYTRPLNGITNIKAQSATGDELTGSQMSAIFTKEKVWGDLVKCYETYGKGRPAIGFTPTIHMADQVTKIFCDAGYNFKTIHGGMNVKEREELINGLKDGSIDGLVNAALLTYGFDCPVASYAFSCRHIKSRPLWFQMVGRILRPAEGKKDAVFVDHGNSIAEFSEPDSPLPILDDLIRWRADGEDENAKNARKERQKKADDTMKILRELDPQPVQMVEVTTEDTYTRLIRVITKLQKSNDGLTAKIQMNEELLEKKQHQIEQATKALHEAQNKAHQAAQEKNDLKKQNEELQKQKIPTIDSDKTFEFIRKNYCKARRYLEDTHNYTEEQAHEETSRYLYAQEGNLDFRFDDITFERGMKYWKNHYSHDWNWRKRAEK